MHIFCGAVRGSAPSFLANRRNRRAKGTVSFLNYRHFYLNFCVISFASRPGYPRVAFSSRLTTRGSSDGVYGAAALSFFPSGLILPPQPKVLEGRWCASFLSRIPSVRAEGRQRLRFVGCSYSPVRVPPGACLRRGVCGDERRTRRRFLCCSRVASGQQEAQG